MWESYVQPFSKPLRSPFWNTSTRRVYGGSGSAVTPKVSMCSSSPVGGRGMSISPRNPPAHGLRVPRARVRRRLRAPGAGGAERAPRIVRGRADPGLDDLVRDRDARAVRALATRDEGRDQHVAPRPGA